MASGLKELIFPYRTAHRIDMQNFIWSIYSKEYKNNNPGGTAFKVPLAHGSAQFTHSLGTQNERRYCLRALPIPFRYYPAQPSPSQHMESQLNIQDLTGGPLVPEQYRLPSYGMVNCHFSETPKKRENAMLRLAWKIYACLLDCWKLMLWIPWMSVWG